MGQIRPRQRGPARLLQGDGEVEHRPAPATERGGEMEAEEALPGRTVPVRGTPHPAAGGVEQLPHVLGRHGAGQPAAHRLGQGTVLLRDSDAHAGRLEHVPI